MKFICDIQTDDTGRIAATIEITDEAVTPEALSRAADKLHRFQTRRFRRPGDLCAALSRLIWSLSAQPKPEATR